MPYVANSSDSIPFGQVFDTDQTGSFFVETREAEGSKYWLQTPIVDSPGFRIKGSLKEERPMGSGVVFRRYDYQMEIVEFGKIGEFRGSVVFRAEKGEPNILSLIYNGKFMPSIYTSPSAIFGSFTKIEQIPQYKLIFYHNPKIKLPKIDLDLPLHPALKVEPIELSQQSVMYVVTVAKSFEDELKTEIVFKTNLGSTPQVRIPVHLRINPGPSK